MSPVNRTDDCFSINNYLHPVRLILLWLQAHYDIINSDVNANNIRNEGNMKRTFVETPIFSKRWSELGLTDDDLLVLQTFILRNPSAGDVIQGTGGLTKLRFAIPDKGKSGGVRALYVDFIQQKKTIMVNCYSKSEKDNISDKEKAIYKKLIKAIKEELR